MKSKDIWVFGLGGREDVGVFLKVGGSSVGGGGRRGVDFGFGKCEGVCDGYVVTFIRFCRIEVWSLGGRVEM